MKAVIVDLCGNDAVALREDGRFEKIKNKNYAIGQELLLQPQVIRFPKQAAIAASAAIVIATCGGMGTYAWSTPVSYVSLDINPSIAYSLNEFNRVIAVSGMNDEGAAIVDAIGNSLKNTDITTALTITVEQLSTDAYLDTENTNYMIIGVYSDKDSRANALMSTVDAFSASSLETCSVTTVNVSKETKESADSYGITGGKMELINEIAHVAADPKEVDPAVLADLTVAELEQTKSVAASGASISEVVASAAPEAKEPKPASANEPAAANATDSSAPETKEPAAANTPETPANTNTVASDTKPSDNSESTSSTKKDESSAEKPSADSSPVVAAAEPTAPADTSSADNTVTGSAANTDPGPAAVSDPASEASSTDHTGNGSSDKKDDSDSETNASSSKGETSSSEKKDDSDASGDKGHSSSDKKDTSSSDKEEEIYEDSSQQTNCAPSGDEITEEPEIVPPLFEDEIFVCSIAI